MIYVKLSRKKKKKKLDGCGKSSEMPLRGRRKISRHVSRLTRKWKVFHVTVNSRKFPRDGLLADSVICI